MCDKAYWLDTFQMPKQFSLKTMSVLKNNVKLEVTEAIKREVISSIATLVMVHTIHPSPEERTALAQRLVNTYPILKDSLGCGYVSVNYNNISTVCTY